jgi:REP element-mobilizing transposase RayT
MPSSFCHVAVHIVFATKNNSTWIKKDLLAQVHAYIAGIISNIGGKPIQVGGIEDHVHILCLIPKDQSLGEFLAKIKANSSKWFRQTHCSDFSWQDGYAAFSVSKSNMQAVENYISNQETHHHDTTAEDEFNELLKKHQNQ